MGLLDAPALTGKQALENLLPVARTQNLFADVILRSAYTTAFNTYRGTAEILRWDMSGFASATIQITGDSSTFRIQGSNDLDSWADIVPRSLNQPAFPLGQTTGAQTWSQENSGSTFLGINKQTRYMRIFTGTGSGSRHAGFQVLLSQTPLQLPASELIAPTLTWSYAAASGGITNSTPVTVVAAQNTSHRNSIHKIQLSNGGATGTEVILTSVADSAVMWRGWLATGATFEATFNPMLRAAANSAISLTLSAASGAAVYANLQGLQGLA